MSEGFDDREGFDESESLDDSEGWWAVGAHLLVVVIIAAPVMILAQFLLSIPFVRSELPLVRGVAIALPAGDCVVRRGRLRYLARRQDRSGSAPDRR
jgi:hypothetical protein